MAATVGRIVLALLALTATFAGAGCGGGGGEQIDVAEGGATLEVRSTFETGGTIPQEFTCEGQDVSIPLSWDEGPEQTAGYAVHLRDPDAPGGTFTHWVLANIPTTDLAAGEVPEDAVAGQNGFGSEGYRGPCPPDGDEPHRYVATVWAVDTELDLEAGFTAAELESSLDGHILATGRIEGIYQR